MTNTKLAIVQDYVPKYRFRFFDQLAQLLAQDGIECLVVASQPRGIPKARGDSISTATWLRQVGSPRAVQLGTHGPRFSGFGTDRYWRDCHGVIMGLRGTSIDLNLELAKAAASRRRIGVWGHLSHFVKPPNSLDLKIERWQMRRSDHVFAYTNDGRDVAIARGIPSWKVTAVMNSTDTCDLMNALEQLGEVDLEGFRNRHSLVPGKTFGFIGGLDSTKRIEFLSEVLSHVWTVDREIKFIVAGQGVQESCLSVAVRRGQVVMLGFGGPAEKALIMRSCQALVNPGRVGLVAVESLAAGIPILAVDWHLHAPEYGYLKPGRDVFVSQNDTSSFADLIFSKTDEERVWPEHSGHQYPTIREMTANFASGVRTMLR